MRVLVQVDEVTHAAWKRRAFEEGRSMSDIARRLIEGAVLEERAPARGDGGAAVSRVASSSVADPSAGVRSSSAVQPTVHDVPVRAHMRADRPAVQCNTRVPAGTTCPDCGKVAR